jgi:primosomal protein N' (replication factor Y)
MGCGPRVSAVVYRRSVPTPYVPSRTKRSARRLRRNMTEAEKRLRARLRDHRLVGWGFRRRHPAPPHVVDFAGMDASLIVEVDGGQHSESLRDAERDRELAARGWRIPRFWNNDVLANTEGVLATILAALGPHPVPPPSAPPPGEGV